MRATTRGLVLVALLAGTLHVPAPQRASPLAHSSGVAVSTVVGRGWFERAICLGCGVAVVAAAGATWGGLLLMSMLNPEPVLACGFACFVAYGE